jgi:hypothetical protein
LSWSCRTSSPPGTPKIATAVGSFWSVLLDTSTRASVGSPSVSAVFASDTSSDTCVSLELAGTSAW